MNIRDTQKNADRTLYEPPGGNQVDGLEPALSGAKHSLCCSMSNGIIWLKPQIHEFMCSCTCQRKASDLLGACGIDFLK